LGTAIPGRGHVHLTEIRGDCAVNPLAPGHLEPYRNATRPKIMALDAIGADNTVLNPAQIGSRFELVVRAQDMPPMRVPPPWQHLPLTPATIKWRLTRADGTVLVPWTYAADFAVTIPPNRDYWRVYAPGTQENVVDRDQHQLPGIYNFRLTPPSSSMPPGRYTATVIAATTEGNPDQRRLSFNVVPSGG
jgi:hypothetical protein